MSEELREQARAQMPSNAIALLDEIETYTGVHVDFAPYTFPLRSNSFNPKAPASIVSPEGATVYLHDFEHIDQHGVVHELLHIQRYLVEGVPMMQPSRNAEANMTALQNIENGLEHLVIVPREATYGLDTSTYWNAVSRHRWGSYPWPNPNAKRNDLLLERLALELVTDPEVLQIGTDRLRTEGLADEADSFAARIKQSLNSKPRALGCVVRFMRIPRGLFHMTRIDIRNRTHRIDAIPDH
jgi:hypothetical protein